MESIPFEIKVLACLRHLGRGECWDTIVELCNDKTCVTTLQKFFGQFIEAMCRIYRDSVIHPPRTATELQSVLSRSERRGFPGCIGYLDGVHVHWDKCPSMWKHLATGKNPYPTVGWQCAVNHNRRFIHVSSAHLGSVNDMTACKYDDFIKELRHNPLYKEFNYHIFDSDGNQHLEKGLWLNVDGGYLRIPECLVGEPEMLQICMNFWTSFMESERKHVECAFGILKARFRILKLPIRMHKFHQIDQTFVTCCILHNMCLDTDGLDDGWNLGTTDPRTGGFIPGQDGYFSEDELHEFYYSEGIFYDITPSIDYTHMGTLYSTVGTDRDMIEFTTKRNKLAQHWYYMYRQHLIHW